MGKFVINSLLKKTSLTYGDNMTDRFQKIFEDEIFYITDTKGLKTLDDFIKQIKTDYINEGYSHDIIKEVAQEEYNEYLFEHSMTAEEITIKLNQYYNECKRAKKLCEIAYRNWDNVIAAINEEIENTDNPEIKQFLTELLGKELSDEGEFKSIGDKTIGEIFNQLCLRQDESKDELVGYLFRARHPVTNEILGLKMVLENDRE